MIFLEFKHGQNLPVDLINIHGAHFNHPDTAIGQEKTRRRRISVISRYLMSSGEREKGCSRLRAFRISLTERSLLNSAWRARR